MNNLREVYIIDEDKEYHINSMMGLKDGDIFILKETDKVLGPYKVLGSPYINNEGIAEVVIEYMNLDG